LRQQQRHVIVVPVRQPKVSSGRTPQRQVTVDTYQVAGLGQLRGERLLPQFDPAVDTSLPRRTIWAPELDIAGGENDQRWIEANGGRRGQHNESKRNRENATHLHLRILPHRAWDHLVVISLRMGANQSQRASRPNGYSCRYAGPRAYTWA